MPSLEFVLHIGGRFPVVAAVPFAWGLFFVSST